MLRSQFDSIESPHNSFRFPCIDSFHGPAGIGEHTLTKVIVKSVTMISWELHPFHTLGGTAYAIRRLADQLTELKIKTRVLLPDCVEPFPGKDLSPLLMPRLLKMRAEQLRAPRVLQCREFSRAALEELEQIRANGGSDAVIAHSLEGAISIILRNGDRSGGP